MCGVLLTKTYMNLAIWLLSDCTVSDSPSHHHVLMRSPKFTIKCILPRGRSLNDPQMEGVCHNCMGVDYMLMACPPGSNMQVYTGGRKRFDRRDRPLIIFSSYRVRATNDTAKMLLLFLLKGRIMGDGITEYT